MLATKQNNERGKQKYLMNMEVGHNDQIARSDARSGTRKNHMMNLLTNSL